MRVYSVVAPLTGEMAARSFYFHTPKTATVTNPAVIHGLYALQNIKSAMHAHSGLPPDDKSSY